jgi:hypothetical protein
MVSEATLGAPTPIAGLEPPEQPEALAMPAQERIGLEGEEGFLPSPDPAGEEDEPEAIGWGEARLPNLAVEDDELLAEEGVLRNESSPLLRLKSRTEPRMTE